MARLILSEFGSPARFTGICLCLASSPGNDAVEHREEYSRSVRSHLFALDEVFLLFESFQDCPAVACPKGLDEFFPELGREFANSKRGRAAITA